MSSSRKAARTPETLDCNQVVDEVAVLFRHTLPSGVRLTPVEVWRPLSCTADRTDLILALMNLCANARDAMPDGGQLSLTAQYALLFERVARLQNLKAGRYVVFEVRDTGCGMSPGVLARATEAFFTTKAPIGTGLGLSEAASFASESGGALSISSREGEGTVVSLYLPAVGPTPTVCRLGPRS